MKYYTVGRGGDTRGTLPHLFTSYIFSEVNNERGEEEEKSNIKTAIKYEQFLKNKNSTYNANHDASAQVEYQKKRKTNKNELNT